MDSLLEDPENYKDLSAENVEYIRKSVKKIIEIEKQFAEDKKKIEEQLSKQDQSNPEVKKVTDKLNELEKQKEEGANKALENISKQSTAKDESKGASYY